MNRDEPMADLMSYLRHYRAHLAVTLGNAAFAAIFLAIVLSGFHQPTPHQLPVGIVAAAPAAPAAQTLEHGLDARLPGAFDLRPVADVARARADLRRGDIDGAVVVEPQRIDLLTAEAGGTAPTQAITGAVTALAAKAGTPMSVTDVVPPSRGDSQGLSSFFLLLCTLIPSLATGIAAGHVLRHGRLVPRLGVLVAVAGIVGLAAAGIADGISDLGHYWAVAGIVSLFSLAISAPMAALGHIKPHLGALCVLAFLVFGIPASGGPADLAAFGPGFLRSLTSGLPLGAGANAVRDTVYFHAAHTTGHVLVLAAYALTGVAVLCLLAVVLRPQGGRPGRPRAAGVEHVVESHYGLELAQTGSEA
jgi:hypothetical protein